MFRYGRTIHYQGIDYSTIHTAHVTPGPAFLAGANDVLLRVPQMGSAWDVDRSSGRMVITAAVVAARVRIVVMQYWLDQFRRALSDKR